MPTPDAAVCPIDQSCQHGNLHRSKYSEWEIRSSYEEYSPNEKPRYHVSAAKGALERKSLLFDQHGQLLNE